MFQNQLQIHILYSSSVTDEKDDTGEDEVTVDIEQILQDESDSEDEPN